MVHEHNPDLFIGLPFALPPTDQASGWLAELDFVDPYISNHDELWALAQSAPSLSAGFWLAGLAKLRQAEPAALAELCIGRRQPLGDEEAAFLRRLDAAAPLAALEPPDLDAFAAACPVTLKHVIAMLLGLSAFKIECQLAKNGLGKVEIAVLEDWQEGAEKVFFDYLWSLTLAAPWSHQARQDLKMYLSIAPLNCVGVTIQEILDSTSSPPQAKSGRGGMSM